MPKTGGCSASLSLYVSKLEALLARDLHSLSDLEIFITKVDIPFCGEDMVTKIFKNSRFFQSEWVAQNAAERSSAFRFGTKKVLISIGYYPQRPTGETYPVASRYVKWKKTTYDYK